MRSKITTSKRKENYSNPLFPHFNLLEILVLMKNIKETCYIQSRDVEVSS